MKKFLLVLLVSTLLYALYILFIPDVRMLKEAYLIKSNYRNNKEQFNFASKDFETFPNISLNFGEDGFIDLRTRGFILYDVFSKLNIDSLNKNELIPWIDIDDSTARLVYKDYVYSIQNFDYVDSALHVATTDGQFFQFDKIWTISYTGFGTSEFVPLVYEASNLDSNKIEEVKAQLRKRNCFGYDRYDENLILHFRSNRRFMIDAYSYCELKDPTKLPEFLEKSFDYGKLNNNTYWFYNEVFGMISYDPWLVLHNREI